MPLSSSANRKCCAEQSKFYVKISIRYVWWTHDATDRQTKSHGAWEWQSTKIGDTDTAAAREACGRMYHYYSLCQFCRCVMLCVCRAFVVCSDVDRHKTFPASGCLSLILVRNSISNTSHFHLLYLWSRAHFAIDEIMQIVLRIFIAQQNNVNA